MFALVAHVCSSLLAFCALVFGDSSGPGSGWLGCIGRVLAYRGWAFCSIGGGFAVAVVWKCIWNFDVSGWLGYGNHHGVVMGLQWVSGMECM